MEFVIGGKRVFAGGGARGPEAGRPCIVLVHGAGMDHTVWAPQARWFAHHGSAVLALDLPGHGRSAGPALDSIAALAAWLLAVLDSREIERFRLAGHSMGALVALEAAAQAGARVEALALLGFAPVMRVHPALLAAARAGAYTAVEMMVKWSFAPTDRLAGDSAPGPRRADATMRLLERTGGAVLATDLAACDAYDGAAAAAVRVPCRTLLLSGGEDRMTPAKAASGCAAQFAAAQMTVLPGVGHMMMSEAPAATLAALQSVM